MKILHVVPSINSKVGGPAQSVPALCTGLASLGHQVEIASLDYPERGPVISPPGVKLHQYPASIGVRKTRGFSLGFYRALRELVHAEVDIVHSHGMWMAPHFFARRSAQIEKCPLVISPRGMLEDWSLSYHGTRKKLAWLAYERGNFAAASAFHATSTMEESSLKPFAKQRLLAVIPNGIQLPATSALPSNDEIYQEFPSLKGKSVLLFMSRFHPKKGVPMLLRQWQRLSKRFPDWILMLAGPHSGTQLDEYQQLAQELKIPGQQILFSGMIEGSRRFSLMKLAEVFVLPSYSENFGIVVGEALGLGTPVISTTATPWEALSKQDCGWWIEPNGEALYEALLSALNLRPSHREAMGSRGQTMIHSTYGWDIVAAKMQNFYQELLRSL